jgi:hypothetical protein
MGVGSQSAKQRSEENNFVRQTIKHCIRHTGCSKFIDDVCVVLCEMIDDNEDTDEGELEHYLKQLREYVRGW